MNEVIVTIFSKGPFSQIISTKVAGKVLKMWYCTLFCRKYNLHGWLLVMLSVLNS